MNTTRKTISLAVIAALAFTAGRLSLDFSGDSSVFAQNTTKKDPPKDAPAKPAAAKPAMPEMDAKMMAMMMPGEHHKALEPLIGTFEGEVTIWMKPGDPPMKSKGTVTREWVLDGHFIHETVEAMSDMGPYKAIGYIGYNNFDGVYEFVWMESVSTGIMTETGVLNSQTKVLNSQAVHRDTDSGHLIHSRGTVDMSNPDRETMSGWSYDENGKEYKSFEGVFERKKK